MSLAENKTMKHQIILSKIKHFQTSNLFFDIRWRAARGRERERERGREVRERERFSYVISKKYKYQYTVLFFIPACLPVVLKVVSAEWGLHLTWSR